MGRKSAQGKQVTGSLGKSLVKGKKQARNTKSTNLQFQGQHVTEIHDSTTERLKSVIDRNALDDFLSDAIMKETQFEAEKAQYVILSQDAIQGREQKQMTEQERMETGQIYDYEMVQIPRRPRWTASTSPDELDRMERDAFLEWRRQLAVMEETSALNRELTPFERNLDVWRQLWRVIERSDVIVQIVDARNPLLYRSKDLENYVREISDGKKHLMLVVNKADFLSQEARAAWDHYFRSNNIDYVFFSAYQQQKRLDHDARMARGPTIGHRHGHQIGPVEAKIQERQQAHAQAQGHAHVHGLTEEEQERRNQNEEARRRREALAAEEEEEEEEETGAAQEEQVEDEQEDDQEEGEDEEEKEDEKAAPSTNTTISSTTSNTTPSQSTSESTASPSTSSTSASTSASTSSSSSISTSTSPSLALLSHEELLDYIKQQYHKLGLQRPAGTRITVGMVGYPNVGKSSTINVLVGAKKVSVGATPGKTKHFQTLMVGDDICLCDCPGLVFPTFLSSRAELVTNGVLPIDEMKDIHNYVEPVEVVCRKISRAQLAHAYSLILPEWKPVTAMDLLQGHARIRGYMKDHGRPDESKSARMILKDYVLGRLLYCQPPPGLTSEQRLAFYSSYRYDDGSLSVKVSREDDELWENQQAMQGKMSVEQREAMIQRHGEKRQAKKAARKAQQHGVIQRQLQQQQDIDEKMRHVEDQQAGIVDDEEEDEEVNATTTATSMMSIRKAEQHHGLKVNRMVLTQIEDSSPQFIDEMGRLSYKPEKLSAKQQLRQKQRYRKTGGQAKLNKYESPLHEMGFASKGNSADAARRMGVSQPPPTI